MLGICTRFVFVFPKVHLFPVLSTVPPAVTVLSLLGTVPMEGDSCAPQDNTAIAAMWEAPEETGATQSSQVGKEGRVYSHMLFYAVIYF